MTRRQLIKLGFVIVTVVLAVACAGILGLKGKGRTPFAHRIHVLKGIVCQDCHKGIESAGESGPLHLPDSASCIECHEKSHDAKPYNMGECLSCHGNKLTRTLAVEAREHLRFEHRTHIPRVEGSCVRCHADIKRTGVPLRPPMAACLTCHPHREQMDLELCATCHTNLDSDLLLPKSHLIHDGDWLREHGTPAASKSTMCSTCHTEQACARCHGATAPMLRSKLMFDNTTRRDLHRAGFSARHSEEARGQPGLCSTCHGTSFCADCHTEQNLSAPNTIPGSIHKPGWVGLPGTINEHGRAARVNPANCASCHSGAGEALCIGCHKVGGIGGNPHPIGWSSRISKTALPCSLCHTLGM